MLLTAMLLSAVLAPQERPASGPQGLEAGKTPASAQATPAAQAVPAATGEAPAAAEPAEIATGLAAFKKRRFAAARAAFERAVEADPGNAAAAFYLGYTHYKLGEPSRRMNADKEKARELFAKAFALDPTFRPTWGR